MRRLSVLLILALGCASPAPVQKMKFSEVVGAPERLTPPPADARAAKTVEQAALVAQSSLELQGALIAFSTRARKFRGGARGDPMPPEAIQNWDQLMTAVDEALAVDPRRTSSYDVIRARVSMEAELELDARTYAELPSELLAAVELRCARLGYRMAQLRHLKVKTEVLQPDFVWPVSPVAVTSLFGRRLHPIAHIFKQHTGIDLAASFGQEVYAAAPGTVLKAEWVGGHGNHVEIQHAGNIVTGYSHLADVLVEPGQRVKQGQAVGLAGSTGVSTGVHLHFELWVNGRPEDPLEELADPAYHPPVAAR